MAQKIGSLFYEIYADNTKLNKGLKDSKSGLSKLSDGFQKLTGFSLSTAGAIGLASVALNKMIEYSKVAIAAASNMQETQSKTKVVFGNAADEVLRFGETAAEAMGMSNEAALAGAAVYGNLFRAMGIAEETSAKMSMSLVQLASDLASFNNMDPGLVLDKLRAGLSGEVEPLRTLGVNLNQAIIQQKALNMGIWDGVGALTAAQKAQASYELILEQTTLAQGDFDRTSEGLANQQRILAANTEDLAAIIGEYLLPAKTALVESQNLLINQTIKYVQGLQKEKDQIERLGLVYDQHLGYMKDGVLLTAEQVTEMKRADRANQAWTDSLNAQAEAYFKLHPEMRQATDEMAASGSQAWHLADGVWKLVEGLNSIPEYQETWIAVHYSFDGLDSRDAAEWAVPTLGAWNPFFLEKPKPPIVKPGAGGATGLSMTVPPGYPNDSFVIGATSGEKVNIDRGKSDGGAFTLDYNKLARAIAQEMARSGVVR